MISNLDKFGQAVKTLKSSVSWHLSYDENDTVMNETLFNKIEWVTGKDGTDTAITTNTNPHSELTWTKVKTEMDKL